MTLGRILVVDDDKNLVDLIQMRLETAGYDVATALHEEDAIEKVKEQLFDLAIVDLQLVNTDGISLMEDLHRIIPEMPVIILTAYGSIESAVEAIKRGAYSYLTKPFEHQELLLQIQKAVENRRLTSEIERLKDLLSERYSFSNVVTRSERMQKVLETISRIAPTESTVLLLGESGTGKDLIAKVIHLASQRKDKPFVAINCAALPETLLESNLFGHEKGAFSGAIRSTKGLFLQADEGTIFLDEIGDMPLSIQAKVLRVLQDKQFYPVGSEKLVEVNVRIIVATNKNLEEQVEQGLFREDLYYRIHVIPIHLPPLRDRKEDIPPLVDHFLNKFRDKVKKDIKGFTPQAMQKLMLHDWPGNVRELENVIEYAAAMTDTELIDENLIFQTKVIPSITYIKPLKEAKDVFERGYLIYLLETCKGKVSEAAKLAGKYRADFYLLLKKHDLNPDDFKTKGKRRSEPT
ncbi:MAG TPA: sigma-54 dependent transcriptional regulator [Syntrophorhabdus sp.]|jgi:two-component system response regulator GlrR|nr:sigma-54-dependent Fis family transcriptional regulator [Syntrophorhabdus sp.]HNQ64019.1 sigma-54 dependent transcriptional regulator [Syntrophorhabdaceae bacterium]MBP8745457.1 sigma-54-dependent Fis family transcriptional regulator [Syntrophorhabdus sp.]HNS77023.1 sigma-54 dependent transcriptional regulator [Syntrophorhabdus sp.]HOD78479.1 sigma-54 dependent transcriptional regulator [Syntrophorhabdus sp.]